MKKIKLLIFIFFSSFGFSQEIFQSTNFKVNSDEMDSSLRKNYVDFSDSEINLILESLILSQDSNLRRVLYGEIIPNYNFNLEERKPYKNIFIIDNKEFYLRFDKPYFDSTKIVFKKDSVLLEYWKKENQSDSDYWKYQQRNTIFPMNTFNLRTQLEVFKH